MRLGFLGKPNIGEYYDTLGPERYNQLANSIGWPSTLQALIGQVMEYKPPATITSVLEVGPGTGHSLEALLQQDVNPSRVIAVDASASMVEEFDSKYPPVYQTVHDTIEHYVAGQQEPEQHDLILALSVLEFVPRLPRELRRLVPHLKPDGLLAFTYDPGTNKRRTKITNESLELPGRIIERYAWRPDIIQGTLAKSGLRVLHQEPVEAVYDWGEPCFNYDFIIAGDAKIHT